MHLNDKYNIRLFQDNFLVAKPFKHIVIHDFLEANSVRKLGDALKKEKFKEKNADLFQLKQTDNLKFSKNKTINEFYKLVSGKVFSDLISEITGIKLKAGAIDLAGSLYEKSDYLLCHDDQLEDRKIAYILYLGEDFSTEDGGALCFLDNIKGKPNKIVQKHYPKYNSIMIFQVSKTSFHEVEEVISDKKRYAVGGWLH